MSGPYLNFDLCRGLTLELLLKCLHLGLRGGGGEGGREEGERQTETANTSLDAYLSVHIYPGNWYTGTM